MDTTTWIIIAAAFFTYLTRIGGHLVLSRFERLHYRVEAALNAVPAAVLTAIVAAPASDHGWRELLVLAVCIILSLRVSMMTMFFAGAALLIALRHFFPI
ncbi:MULTISPECIES: AzlD family protein [Brucella/Ochrobactrum group]|uniref:Msl1536 protein n=1 Tax=Ochrobactrum soli TaxID=2448455 RepID=A0A2P9HP45_9HYPH|nr:MULTISPECIES: AzlD family protein [Brucella]MCI1001683.1 AzlD family protein [Ochrobactrum sp. C6C9]RRD24895.1 AzlD family protein [Brucellaceae bacterium VT-16-1752]WHT42201.1 AzlD family protein [Ochrobactrum sp. SSR]MDX4076535.1 AzlD family protein [Brucella sp. NBRC 113783]WHS31337.1 AzlD family protein [Brucella sp. NM4]